MQIKVKVVKYWNHKLSSTKFALIYKTDEKKAKDFGKIEEPQALFPILIIIF